MKVFRLCLAATALASLLAGGAALADPADKLEHIKPVLVAPPNVMAHEQATKAKPRVVEFTMTIEEKKIVVDEENGTTMQAMTFNGSMPGPTMVVHEGDYVQLTLINPSTNALEHNIDFHASTGALGGGALTKIKPGEQTVLRFKARLSVPARWCSVPQLARRQPCAFGQGGKLQPSDARMGVVESQGGGGEAAVGARDDVLTPDELGKANDTLGDQFRMLHEICRMADHAGNDDFFRGQFDLLEDMILVLVARVGRFE